MNTEKKEKITQAILQKKESGGLSNNAFAKSMSISPAHFSNLINKQYSLISDTLWRKLEDLSGIKNTDWPSVDTAVSKIIRPVIEDAQTNSSVYAIVAHAGSGKSHVASEIAQNTQNVYLVTCEEGMGNKHLLSELLVTMGVNPAGMSNYDKLKEIVRTALKKQNPLIIFDEWEKLDDRVRYYFITLYNKLEDKCGFVILSTYRLKFEIERGLRRGKRGYEEIFSRFGGRFIQCPKISLTDIDKACKANDIRPEDFDKIAKESYIQVDAEGRYDMRRVKKIIKKYKAGRATEK